VVVPGEHGVLAGGGVGADFVVDEGEDALVVLVDEGPGGGVGAGRVALGCGGVELTLEVGDACEEVAFGDVDLASWNHRGIGNVVVMHTV